MTPAWLTGLSAFPLTPVRDGRVDDAALRAIVSRLVAAGVDSIGGLGSTGCATYLSRSQRRRASEAIIEAAEGTPVLIGVSETSTEAVLRCVDDAQASGADGILLAPVSCHRLTDDEVVGLFADVAAAASVPLIVYENPATTTVTLAPDVLAAIAESPRVTAVKIAPASTDEGLAVRVREVRAAVPRRVRIGISGDSRGAAGLLAGCDLWFSSLGGILPEPILAIARAAESGHVDEARRLSDALGDLWDIAATHGGMVRVAAAVASLRGLAEHPVLPRPLKPLPEPVVHRIAAVLSSLDQTGRLIDHP